MTFIYLIVFFFMFLFMFEGASSETVFVHIYSRAGEDSSLPCDRLQHHGPQCSSVDWFYYKQQSSVSLTKVRRGQVQDGPSSSRLTLNSDCSLRVHNINKEDSGLFFCRLSHITDSDTNVYLSVLTVSAAPQSTDPNLRGTITLQCTLWRGRGVTCGDGSLRWLNISGTVLSGAGVTQNKCVSSLTVERQSQHNRTYTCQFVEENVIKISAEFTLKGNPADQSKNLTDSPDVPLVSIVSAAGVSLLVLLFVVVVVVFKIKSKRNSAQTVEETEVKACSTHPVVDPVNNVTYATINHQNKTALNQVQVELDEAVTYSTVNIKTTALLPQRPLQQH